MRYISVITPSGDIEVKRVNDLNDLIKNMKEYENKYLRSGWVFENRKDIDVISEKSIKEAWIESDTHQITLVSYYKPEGVNDAIFITIVNAEYDYSNLIFAEEIKRYERLEKLKKL